VWVCGRDKFSWDGFGWPLTAEPPGAAQSAKQSESLPPTVLWLAFHPRLHSSSSSASTASFLPDPSTIPLDLRLKDAATPEKLHAMLQQNVCAMQWLSERMTDLSPSICQLPISKLHITLPFSSTHPVTATVSAVNNQMVAAPAQPAVDLVPEAEASGTDALDAFISTVKASALLSRFMEIQSFLVDRVYTRTPLQRAMEDRDNCCIVRKQVGVRLV